jgi:hypothetical protein
MRRGQSKSNCEEKPSVGASPSTTKQLNEGSSQISQTNKRSTTATIEGICPPTDQPKTTEINLASEEDDMTNESDSLLQYGTMEEDALKIVTINELNGTTYL